MPKGSKIQRGESYKDHRVQLLLSKFVSGELSNLTPIYDPKRGYRYLITEKIVGEPVTTDDFLDDLFDAGVLERELYDKIIYCPNCNSANVSMHYCCPHCKSFNIRKSALIEHVPCGYIDAEDKFQKNEKLVCPKCGKELSKPDVDHRKAGVWCTCSECGKNFDIPVPLHFCRDCNQNFAFEDALYEDVYLYKISDEAKQEAARGLILIAPIREFFEKHEFNVETPGFLKGKSGASHMFDVMASHGGISRDITVIDLATATEDVVSEQSIIAMFAKVYDVSPEKAYLIAIPKINENGKRLANLYNIELIEAKDQNEALKHLKATIKE
jgi:transcription elongation factor Elf1